MAELPQQTPALSLPPRRMLALAVAFEGGLGVFACVVGWLVGYPPWPLVRWSWQDLLWGLIAAGPPLTVMLAVVRWPVGPLRQLVEFVERELAPLFRGHSLVNLAAISALAGIGEELLFRGLIQQAAADRWGPIGGPTVAAVLFGLAHPLSAAYIALAAAIGAYLGWLLIATDNLLAPIVAHAVYDFAALVYLLWWRRPATSQAAISEESAAAE